MKPTVEPRGSGAGLGPIPTLLRFLRENNRVPLSRVPALLLFLIRGALSTPGALVERAFWESRIQATTLRAGPLFILGHYRSGTTLVHKLLASDPRFGSVSTFDLIAPYWPVGVMERLRPLLQWLINRLKIKQGFFHDYLLRLDDPNETEPLMLSCGSELSTYWGYVFPRNADLYLNRYQSLQSEADRCRWTNEYARFLKRTTLRAGGKRIVVKDPPNTARIPALLEAFPDARFIVLHRRPTDVFRSMRNLWQTTIEPRFALQSIGSEERDAIILSHYRKLLTAYKRNRDSVPEGALFEVRYEDLIADPLGVLERAYSSLDLPEFSQARRQMVTRLEEDRDFRPTRHGPDSDLGSKVRRELEPWTDWLGYSD